MGYVGQAAIRAGILQPLKPKVFHRVSVNEDAKRRRREHETTAKTPSLEREGGILCPFDLDRIRIFLGTWKVAFWNDDSSSHFFMLYFVLYFN